MTIALKHKPDIAVAHDRPRDLGDGLILRFATPGDSEALAQFNGRVLSDEGFSEGVAAWTRDFASEAHPTCGPSNVTLVEDTRAGGKIVSSMCLIPQTWTYAGIPFGVGRPEAVGTDPAYRRRGLVRAQFEVHHARSAAMGHLVQGITGIPWYYRQFGYEYALDLDGGRQIFLVNIPTPKDGEAKPYRLRPMTPDDLPFAAPLYERDCARWLVACPRPEWMWQYQLTGASPASFESRPLQIVETAEGRAVGYVSPEREMWDGMFRVTELSVIEGQSLRAVMPSLLRALRVMAEAEAARRQKIADRLCFQMGQAHPVFDAIPELLPQARPAYGWYIRVADLPGFLRHVAPALEARLAPSVMAGYTGELKIHAYRSGFRLMFEQGRLTTVEPWRRPDGAREEAAFPPLVFLQLLFGFRSLADLRYVYPDCSASDEAAVLLDLLFPRQPSFVFALS